MIKVGIIGTGVGIRTHLPAFRALDGISVKGIAGSTAERATQAAIACGVEKGYQSYAELCSDPEIDLVCITSPNPLHIQHTNSALAAGKHVLCEKPLGMSLEECDALVSASRMNAPKLALVNHQLRLNPYMREIRRIVRSGELGRVFYCRMHQQGSAFSNRQMPWSWSFDGGRGGGVRLAMGSHLLDLATYIFGNEVEAIACTLDPVVPSRVDAEGESHNVTGSGFVSMRLTMRSNCTLDLTATAAAHGKSKFDISIYGDRGEIQFDLDAKLRLANGTALGKEVPIQIIGVFDDELANKVSIFSGSFRYLAAAIHAYLLRGESEALNDACTFDEARGVQKLLDSALLSYRESRPAVFGQQVGRRSDLV